MKSGRMKRILLSVIAFLFVGCSIAGGTVLLSNTSISDSNRGGDSTSSENEITKNAPTNSDLWTNGHYATAFDNEGEAGIDGTTEEKAYEIRTAEQLARLAYLINDTSTNSTYRDLYYVQTADIDLSLHYWDAIGTSSYYFSGHYDGGNFTISGVYTQAGSSSTYSYQGLFGYVIGQSKIDKAIIKNVGIIDSNIQGYRFIGGVVGYADSSTVTNCYNTGSVTGSGDYVDGVVGYAYYSIITNCYNTGAVDGYDDVGGVVGYVFSSIITNCYNTGEVTGSGSDVGGVVGWANSSSTITNCYNTGNITGSDVYTGGVVGDVSSSSAVTNCYNTGSVTGSGSNVGGVVGRVSFSTITNCYNTGAVDGGNEPGGVVGRVYYSASTITNNYYGGNCTLSYGIGDSSSNTGASKDENLIDNAKSLSWYQDSSKWDSEYSWDFENVWRIDSNINNGYPYLSDLFGDMFPNDISYYWTNEGNYADSFAGGSGTESDPYKISTPEQLARLAYLVNNGSEQYMFSNTYFVQTANLDMSEYWWDAIGTYTSDSDYQAFSGNYDGGNFTISGLYTEAGSSSAYSYQGLFGYVRGQSSIIENVGIIDSNIQGYQYVGGVVGWVRYSIITNCYNTGNVTGDGGSYSYTGGVVGYADALNVNSSVTITNCYNTGTVTGSGYHVGGVVGFAYSYSTITNSYNTGTVTGVGSVGGIVGYADETSVTNCYNTGSIDGSYGVGGVVGSASYSSTITNCYSTGFVAGTSNVGGVVGHDYNSSSTITTNYYGGNCTLSYGIGSPSSNTGASKDSNLIANAKSLSWYQNSSKWSSRYPWDFEEVWSLVPSANDGYPILQGFSVNITYNSNFGENETITEQVPSGQEIVIAGYDLFTRVGYEIAHWNTKADGTGFNFYAGDTYSEGAGLTLYAIWEAGIYSVTLDANGGSGGTSAIYLKYDSGWYSSSSCTSSSKITALPSTPTRTGYEFKGYSTEPDGSGTLAVSATGAINVSDTFYSTDGTRTWYAVWEARNPAYYDSEGGFWYVENGKLPQSKVSGSLKSTLSSSWGSLSNGDVYYMGVEELADGDLTTDGGMQSKVYDGEEYVKFNGEFYLAEPIRWRLVYSSSQKEGYAVENTSVLATMAEIVFLGGYSSAKIGVGAGYSAESVTMLLKNQVSTEFLVNESREVEIFGTPKDTTTASGSVFVASMEELANFTTSKNNTTGSGVKAGKASFSDFVKDYLRATGQGNYYFTRDLGDQLNTIRCLNPVGDRSQAKAQQTLGVQFTIKVTEYACISA